MTTPSLAEVIALSENEVAAMEMYALMKEAEGDIDMDDPDEIAELATRALNTVIHLGGIVERFRTSAASLRDAALSVHAAAWIRSRDTGMSSEAIWQHMACGASQGCYPVDPSDYGRCHRLLTAVPEWRPRIGEMAKYNKGWAALVPRWDAIEAAYIEEVGDGRPKSANKTYELIRAALEPIYTHQPAAQERQA